jgi:hypothetical protein
MSAPAVVWIAVGLTTTLAIAAMLIALARHAILLGRTLRRFQDEVQPLADEIATGSGRAASRTQRLGTELPFGRR